MRQDPPVSQFYLKVEPQLTHSEQKENQPKLAEKKLILVPSPKQ